MEIILISEDTADNGILQIDWLNVTWQYKKHLQSKGVIPSYSQEI